MKCSHCGYENKSTAKFCSKCGNSIEETLPPKGNDNSKVIIAALVAIIIALALGIGYFAFFNNADHHIADSAVSQASNLQENASVPAAGSSSEDNTTSQQTTSLQSSTSSQTKQWELIGSYTGSGSGTQTISVPAGEIRVELSAYPIKNYATNHLYVSGSNGASGGVDWGSDSAVETRSDSFTYTSSSPQTFTIDYYETVSWQVDFYIFR